MRKSLLYLMAALAVGLVCAAGAFAAVNAPSNLQVVPRYSGGGTITMILSWTDNAAGAQNEQGFAIERREAGGAFAALVNVAANTVQYEDATATGDKWWEYRVKATHAGLGDSTWSNTSDQNSPRQAWPLHTGAHNVLYTHCQPISAVGTNYFHGGTDLAGAGDQVDAARGGIVTAINNSVGGTLHLDVDYGPDGIYEDWYLHTIIDPVLAIGDNLVVGDKVGNISTVYFGHADSHHVHWGMHFHNLERFTVDADRDPNDTAPTVADTNGDGHDFIVVDAANNNHAAPREPAWGNVDFLVDAFDDMSVSRNLRNAPLCTGYWIQAGVDGGENVRSGAAPYRLLNFNLEKPGYASLFGIENDVFYAALPGDLLGENIWGVFLTWIVTNTRGTDGALANVSGAQFWKTDARKGSGVEPNGSDALKARENQDARFRDGTYFVHIITEDFIHSADTVRSVLVDNSRPYVKKVTVYSGARIVYQSFWQWNAATAQLIAQPSTFDAAAAFTAFRTQDITVEVEFSEPMSTAAITAVTPAAGVTALPNLPTLVSTQSAHARTTWRGLISNLDIDDNGANDGVHMLTINGTDLAGNALLQINNRNTMGADHHNRNAAGALQGTAGTDTIHGFRIGPLEGTIPVTAIFMKTTAVDPVSPTVAQKANTIEAALNTYFGEVSYGEINFAVTGHGWYQLNHALNWYETWPRTPLIDLVQEAVDAAQNNGVDLSATDYLLVVTDENAARPEWSTNGAWPYNVTAAPGWRLMAGGTMNLASSDPRITNLAGRLVGLIDLFPYPEVIVARPFVGPWSHMSDKEHNVHVLGWEKWRVGWLDETGTATGNTLTRVPKPAVAAPIVNQTYTIRPMDTDNNDTKMVAINVGDRLYYTAEYRRQQHLDSSLPDAGVVITKTNDYVNQGEGPAIIQESAVTSRDLSDAPHTTTAPRNVFNDVGSGVNIEVTSMNANEAQIRLNYAVPATENDVYVTAHDDRWQAVDIWIDAPDLAGHFAADPLTVINANEKPVVNDLNKVYGRVRNQGHADATNFEVHLDIREPWAAGGPFRSLKVDTVTLQGQDTNPGAYYLISADWTPSGDVHSCVKLTVQGVANDINTENNWTQENISQFATTRGSPYAPITTRFEVENPFDETITAYFKLDGLPESWTYILTPARLTLTPKGVGSAQITIQPADAAPVCSREVVTVGAYTPRVDTLKQLGAITLQIGLKNKVTIDAKTVTRCGQVDPKASARLTQATAFDRQCEMTTQGCTTPAQANTQVAVVYTAPDGTKHVRYVTTDANGCYSDTVTVVNPALWETQVVLEESDCTEEARTPPQGGFGPGGTSALCRVLWALMLLALMAAIIWFARWRCDIPSARLPFVMALAATLVLGWLLLQRCDINPCWFWLSVALAVIIALVFIIFSPFVPCIGRCKDMKRSG